MDRERIFARRMKLPVFTFLSTSGPPITTSQDDQSILALHGELVSRPQRLESVKGFPDSALLNSDDPDVMLCLRFEQSHSPC